MNAREEIKNMFDELESKLVYLHNKYPELRITELTFKYLDAEGCFALRLKGFENSQQIGIQRFIAKEEMNYITPSYAPIEKPAWGPHLL